MSEWIKPDSPEQASRFLAGCLEAADECEAEAEALRDRADELVREAKRYRARAADLRGVLTRSTGVAP